MSHVLKVHNVNNAFSEGWWLLRAIGLREESRNGPVMVAPGPVITEYQDPCERVLWSPERDANHVFHLMEALWMLAGENKIDWLSQFSSNIANYAEVDGVVHGAYGYRWRSHFGIDQIQDIVRILKKDPNSRQAVMQMWDPRADLLGTWRDRPCNTAIYFDCRGSNGVRALNMTVTCRSNDMLWGAYGANAVHFSILQEFIAHAVGVPVGVYRQFSNNFHVYTENPQVKQFLENPPAMYDLYTEGMDVKPLMKHDEDPSDFLNDCKALVFGGGAAMMKTEFIKLVAVPLRDAYLKRKAKDDSWRDVQFYAPCDWTVAFCQWADRREK